MCDSRRGVSDACGQVDTPEINYVSNSFDLELPLEVDDDYWEHPDPAQAFKQPPGMPSSISFFNCFLKLTQILAFGLRTIVSNLTS